MMLQVFFAASTFLVLPFWLLMIGLPQWRFTQALLRSPLVLLPLPVLYVALLAVYWPLLMRLLEHPNLTGVALVLGEPEGALIAWVHFLAFDFFVGRWAYLDSLERGIHYLAMTPILWLTLLVGPVGLAAYLILRGFCPPKTLEGGQEGRQADTAPAPTAPAPDPHLESTAVMARRPQASGTPAAVRDRPKIY
jgi:hypothetical protein